VDFRDLNRATPKDEYPMPVAETLINAAAGHKMLSFMDGNAGYNQIFMAPEDIHKTAFRVPGAVGLFEYVVMTFGLKNAGATYQRAMNYMFHDLIGKLVEIYIDDVVVKSASAKGHIGDLRRVLERTRMFGLRMNPKKCAFGVSAGQFLGFLVHERGIEIGLKSQEAVKTMVPPTTKKELQQLIGKINFVRRFISNLSGRIEPFMELVKIKTNDEFRWGAEQQQAFEEIKEYLSKPPVLVPPQQGKPFYVYLSVGATSIASVIIQVQDGKERVVFYLSRRMLDAETRYPEIEKLCLCLFFTCTKLRHILLSAETIVICKSDVIKHMLSAPVLKGRLGKWMFALSEFDVRYQPAKAVKGQALADLVAERTSTDILALSIRAWAMYFDGSVCGDGSGIGILLVSPRGATYSFSIRLTTPCTNNLAEYEAVRKGMELLLEAGAEAVEVFGDSKLVISQLTETYRCESELLFPLWRQCQELMAQFRYINFYWIPRIQNSEANDLAQMASGYKDTAVGAEFPIHLLGQEDWRADIFNYLKDPAWGAPKKIRYRAMKYVLIGDDLFYRTLEGLLLKCLGPIESNRLLHEVHEGTCGTHQSAHKMKWLIRRSGYHWPDMLEDCFKYYKGCQACQRFGRVQIVPASAMNPIIKPWPFRGWGMDMIGKINPPSSKGHQFILAITDYFTKWVEAVPMKSVTSRDVINFVKEHVIHRFGIPQTITTDGGSVFISDEFKKFAADMGIKLIRSSPYYAQANGQAEASNQSLIKLIKRKIDEFPRRWHEVLSEALWAYRVSCHGATRTSPYHLVYGQEAVLPWEITAGSRRIEFQNELTAEEYAALMSDNVEDITELRLWSLEKIKENKAKVAHAYNKKVKPKEFQVGDLVWEAVLPLGTKDAAYGKWSPNWHGPYRVDQVLPGNAYMLEELDGSKFPVAVNGQHLKKYFPSMWEDE
jgi:ribonuclease HI